MPFTLLPFLAALVPNVFVNAAGWAVSSALSTDLVYDVLGALAHVFSIIVSLVATSAHSTRSLVATTLVVVWATRLGAFLFLRILAAGGDPRLERFKKSPVLFIIPWFMQAIWVLCNTLPVTIMNGDPAAAPELRWYDAAPLGLWLAGFLIETIADEQKRIFHAAKANRGHFITTGLWALSRHPNYFGEIAMQVGVAAFCAPAFLSPLDGKAAVLLSPLFVVWLLTCVSGIPLLERSGKRKWGEDARYRAYLASTPVLVPRCPALCGGRRAVGTAATSPATA